MGYDVSCSLRNTFTILGFYFYVVSSSHSVSDMQSAIWHFATSIADMISNSSDEVYANQVSALRMKLLAPANSLQESADEHWRSLEDTNSKFTNISDVVAAELLNVEKNCVSLFCKNLFCESRALIVQCDTSGSSSAQVWNESKVSYNIWPQTGKSIRLRFIE